MRVCFFGPMIGKHPGRTTTQEFVISELFRGDAKYEIAAVSSSLNRYIRLLDMIFAILRMNRSIDIGILSIYGGPSIIVEQVVSILCWLFRIPMIMVLHGGALPQFSERHPRWVKSTLSRGNVIVAPSHFLAISMQKYSHVPIRLVPNVIHEGDYPFTCRDIVAPKLLWMRSFHEIYNPRMALEVVCRLKEKYPCVRLFMCGMDKGELDSCQRLASSLGIQDHVQFPGFIDAYQKIAYASRADVFINTSRIDNTPVAHLEAAALGMPIVSTDVGGIPYLFEHENTALLVPNEDVGAMVKQIERLLECPTLVTKLSRNGRLLAQRSFWSNVKPAWEEMFVEVSSRSRY